VNPELPKDGFIFRFGPEDEFTVPGPGGEATLVQGELRMLGLQIDDRGTPELTDDDLVERVVMELAVAPAPFPPLTVIRLDISMQYDLMGEPLVIKLGDAGAADRTAPHASFIADALIAIELATLGDDVEALVQIYSLTESYVLRLGASMAGLDPTTEIFASTELYFGFGRTTDPTRPPWIFAVKLSDPLTDPQSGMTAYAVDGSVSLRGGVIATMVGSTSEIQLDVDVNGDRLVDAGDTCIDVDVVFSDDPDSPQNLCVVMQELWMLFSSGMSKTIGAMP
jgi:hypothetical protein